MTDAVSMMAPVQQPTVRGLVSGWPLWRIARYVRRMTESVAVEEDLSARLELASRVRDKVALAMAVTAMPPMSMLVTDHRIARPVLEAGFGFGRPVAYRAPVSKGAEGMMVLLPARRGDEVVGGKGDDEGIEFNLGYEKDLLDGLLTDEEWNRYVEFRGVDVDLKD